MPRKSTKSDDREQSKRFIETAKEVGADEDGEALERAFEPTCPVADYPAAGVHGRN